MENRALLRDCCEQMGVSLGEKETEQFMTYLSLLLEWNEKEPDCYHRAGVRWCSSILPIA